MPVKDLNKVDLYSLGVALYHLIFGTFPFGLTHEDAKNYDKIYEKIIQGMKIEICHDDYSKILLIF